MSEDGEYSFTRDDEQKPDVEPIITLSKIAMDDASSIKIMKVWCCGSCGFMLLLLALTAGSWAAVGDFDDLQDTKISQIAAGCVLPDGGELCIGNDPCEEFPECFPRAEAGGKKTAAEDKAALLDICAANQGIAGPAGTNGSWCASWLAGTDPCTGPLGNLVQEYSTVIGPGQGYGPYHDTIECEKADPDSTILRVTEMNFEGLGLTAIPASFGHHKWVVTSLKVKDTWTELDHYPKIGTAPCSEEHYTRPEECVRCPEYGAIFTRFLGLFWAGGVGFAVLVLWKYAGDNFADHQLGSPVEVMIHFGGQKSCESRAKKIKSEMLKSLNITSTLVEVDDANDNDDQNHRKFTHAATTPAVVFILTKEWVLSETFDQDIIKTMAARTGVDITEVSDKDSYKKHHETILDIHQGGLAGMREGIFFVVIDDLSSQAGNKIAIEAANAHNMLSTGLGFKQDNFFAADDPENLPAMIDNVRQFLKKGRIDPTYAAKRAEFKELVGRKIDGLDYELETGNPVAVSTLRILLPHAQIVAWMWSLSWKWPDFVHLMQEYVGGFVNADMITILKPECFGLHRGVTMAVAATTTSFWVVVLFICLWSMFGTAKAAGAVSEKARIMHFSLAMYSLSFPLIVIHAVPFMAWAPTHVGLDGGIQRTEVRMENEIMPHMNVPWYVALLPAMASYWWLVAVSAIIPFFVLRALRANKDQLYLSAIYGRFGWLYDVYEDEYYYYELMLLEIRFFMIFFAYMLPHHVMSMFICLLAVGINISLHSTCQPFKEFDLSGGPGMNFQAAVCNWCQFFIVVCGAISYWTEANLVVNQSSQWPLILAVCFFSFLPGVFTVMTVLEIGGSGGDSGDIAGMTTTANPMGNGDDEDEDEEAPKPKKESKASRKKREAEEKAAAKTQAKLDAAAQKQADLAFAKGQKNAEKQAAKDAKKVEKMVKQAEADQAAADRKAAKEAAKDNRTREEKKNDLIQKYRTEEEESKAKAASLRAGNE